METKYVVIRGTILAYVLSGEERKEVGLQSANILATKESHLRPGDVFGLPIKEVDGVWYNDHSKFRPATKEDFKDFRVVPPPQF